MLRRWENIPEFMKNEEVKVYYDLLTKRKGQLLFKRVFDLIVALVFLIILSPLMLIIAVAIKLTSKGPVFFRQVRITQYGKEFKIFKFRTMIVNAESFGSQVTVGNDMRITNVGKKLRKCRLDELPQLINIILGDMSFVGTRPEIPKYVKRYKPEMIATLLLPSGVTSEASIFYKDEDILLENAESVDDVYVHEVLPGKMKYNLDSIEKFNCIREIGTMIKTVFAVIR